MELIDHGEFWASSAGRRDWFIIITIVFFRPRASGAAWKGGVSWRLGNDIFDNCWDVLIQGGGNGGLRLL